MKLRTFHLAIGNRSWSPRSTPNPSGSGASRDHRGFIANPPLHGQYPDDRPVAPLLLPLARCPLALCRPPAPASVAAADSHPDMRRMLKRQGQRRVDVAAAPLLARTSDRAPPPRPSPPSSSLWPLSAP